jgi:large subunit ribosomal protein L29
MLRETLFKDQLKLKTGTLDNPSERTEHKRDLARVLTVITAKKKAAKPATKTAQKATRAKA